MNRTSRSKKLLKCGRRVVVGDVVETLTCGLGVRCLVTPANVDARFLAPVNFGKTWRWIKSGRLPEACDEIEVYKDVTIEGERGKVWAWRRERRIGGGVRSRRRGAGRVEFFMVAAGTREFTLDDEGPFWRWPHEQPVVKPAPPEPAPSMPQKTHYAKLFAERANAAINAVGSLERVRAIRALTLRAAHDAVARLAPSFEKPLSQQWLIENGAIVFTQNILYAGMHATELLHAENTSMRNAVSRLHALYDEIAHALGALNGATILRDFIKADIVGAPAARIECWQYLLREWESIDADAAKTVNLARMWSKKPDGKADFALAK